MYLCCKIQTKTNLIKRRKFNERFSIIISLENSSQFLNQCRNNSERGSFSKSLGLILISFSLRVLKNYTKATTQVHGWIRNLISMLNICLNWKWTWDENLMNNENLFSSLAGESRQVVNVGRQPTYRGGLARILEVVF